VPDALGQHPANQEVRHMSVISQVANSATRRPLLSGRRLRKIQEAGLGYLFLLPAFLVIGVFEFYGVFAGLRISLCTNYRIRFEEGTGCIWGLANYIRAFNDPEMWHSISVTIWYAVLSVPVQLAIALVLAYLLFQNIRGKSIYRVLFFMPYITSTVASAAVWAFLYNPDKGLINNILHTFGIDGPKWLGEPRGIFDLIATAAGVQLPSWAAGPSLALVSIIVYTTWVFVGYDTTIFLAGLGNIPNELYEAARIDGANGWQLFRRITVPLLSPTTFFLLIYTIIGTFKAFNHIYVMTLGGPGTATTTTAIMIFKQMYEYTRYGYSAALSFVLFIVILTLTILQNRVAGSRVVYS
jgi:multiple sugar transport system permease protein